MDSDRKSTVSSFYGRKNSMDALNNDFPAQNYPVNQSRGRDDASSFYRGDNRNVDSGRPGAAGYNRNSYFLPGREEPVKGGRDEEDIAGNGDAWNIYADFNNAGPKYSNTYGGGSDGYQSIPNTPHSPKPEAASLTGNVELVTVPALGPEWKREELRDMTKSARKEKKAENRAQKFKEWNRGERGICGRWFTRKMTVIVLFVLCVIAGIILAFVIPRVPKFDFNSSSPLANATGDWKDAVPLTFNRAPANFSFPAFADLQVDTTASYIPIKFTKLHAEIFDLDTNRQVGFGDMNGLTLPAKEFNKIMIPLNFSYVATNDTDATWVNWYNACRNAGAAPGGIRDGLKFRLSLSMNIFGLIGTQKTSTPVSSANCPVELSITAG